MKLKKILLGLLSISCLGLSTISLTSCDSDYYTEGLEFKTHFNGLSLVYSVVNYSGESTNVTIPSTYKGKPVTKIETNAFNECSTIESISIPNSITYIGAAFRNCTSLASITIPESVGSIVSGTFIGCTSLTVVKIGNGVSSIGSSAFKNCSSLISITIPNSVTSIGSHAFEYCEELVSISLPDNIAVINSYTFSNCNSLKSITVPNSVEVVYECAFMGCNRLNTVYYKGTREQWNKISISYNNILFKISDVVYNYKG